MCTAANAGDRKTKSNGAMVSVSVLRNYAKVSLATKKVMKHKQMNPLARVQRVGSRLVSNTHLKNAPSLSG